MEDNKEEFVKRPYTEQEMQQKLEDMRKGLSEKMGKWADRITVSMAIQPKIERVEGERWEEGGKTYVLKNGFKQSVNPLDAARMPWWCPKCSKSMNHRFDRKFFALRGFCYNCNIDVEGEMRLKGTWNEYERKLVRSNEKAFLRDKINETMEYMRTFKEPQIHFEDGRWEKLAVLSDFTQLFETLEKDIEFMTVRLEEIAKLEEEENATAENTHHTI
jgi:hypothetical protein